MKDSLFSLLRLGLCIEQPSAVSLKFISGLTFDQWTILRTLSEKQGVSAIVLDGLNSLISMYGQHIVGHDIDNNRWKEFLLEWMGTLLMTEHANIHQKDVMNDLAREWCDGGCRVMVMKGQANGIFYPNPNHRSPGDIDCYLFENYGKGNTIARNIGAQVDESWYKHSVINYKGETFENHLFFVTTRDGKEGKKLEKELEAELQANFSKHSTLSEFVSCPPSQWTAMFLTYHSCSHFISEGLRLKQILDWAMFLKRHQDDIDWVSFYSFCDRHHLGRFADVATSIVVQYIGVRVCNSYIRTKSQYTERVLQSVLYDDDYVFGSGKGNWYNRFHLIKNLWKYRWKYRDIYEMSPLRQLWYYASGFIFKTE